MGLTPGPAQVARRHTRKNPPKELSRHKEADGFQIHGQVAEKEGARSRGGDGGGEGAACFNASLVIIVTGMNG